MISILLSFFIVLCVGVYNSIICKCNELFFNICGCIEVINDLNHEQVINVTERS
jgi:hypothetical protein